MKMKKYLKDQWFSLLLFFLMMIIILLLLLVFKSNIQLVISILILITTFYLLSFFYQFYRKQKFYNEFVNHLNQLEQKYLIVETLNAATFYEGQILTNSLYEINKSMLERINYYQRNVADFKEYIEMWIHDVKLPLSSLTLIIHNRKNENNQELLAQVQRLDNSLDQILYYIRSENTEKDYLISENSLEKVIGRVALKNQCILLERKIEFIVTDVKHHVLTDGKWLEFILNQLIDNSIKYSNQNQSSYIKIAAKEEKDKIILAIYDNGIGISSTDLPKIFDKTFTGKNGRLGAKSTGMGLYIVKKLCNKLGHKIEIISEEGRCTIVKLTFAKNKYYDVVK